jgi:hypothetical protein
MVLSSVLVQSQRMELIDHDVDVALETSVYWMQKECTERNEGVVTSFLHLFVTILVELRPRCMFARDEARSGY